MIAAGSTQRSTRPTFASCAASCACDRMCSKCYQLSAKCVGDSASPMSRVRSRVEDERQFLRKDNLKRRYTERQLEHPPPATRDVGLLLLAVYRAGDECCQTFLSSKFKQVSQKLHSSLKHLPAASFHSELVARQWLVEIKVQLSGLSDCTVSALKDSVASTWRWRRRAAESFLRGYKLQHWIAAQKRERPGACS